MPDWLTTLDWIGLATLVTIVLGLYKLYQEAKAAKATAETASSNAEMAASSARIAMMHAEQTLSAMKEVAGTVREIATNTNGMQKHIEELVRADERHIEDERQAGRRPEEPA